MLSEGFAARKSDSVAQTVGDGASIGTLQGAFSCRKNGNNAAYSASIHVDLSFSEDMFNDDGETYLVDDKFDRAPGIFVRDEEEKTSCGCHETRIVIDGFHEWEDMTREDSAEQIK